MARVKAEVKEHAQRLARQRQHTASLPVEVKVEAPAVADAVCVDLTADEETEDEEDADEPFAATAFDERRGQDIEMEAMDVPDQERRPGHATNAVSDPVVGFADDDETDESEVDEEMPLARPGSADAARTEDSSSSVARGVDRMGAASSPTVGLVTTTSEGELGEDASVQQGASDTNGDAPGLDAGAIEEEEEEDEQWPELRPRGVQEEEEKQRESADDDVGSTGSEGEDGGDQSSSTANDTGTVRTGNSLEDGEIFEEGAVAKSPTAVKEAIELELQARAAASAKKKQKKRGRKKNKRKAEAMLATTQAEEDQVDEFGRNVRHQPMPPAVSVTQASHVQDFLPSMAIRSAPPPIEAKGHSSPLLPRPPFMAPAPQPPLPPPHDFGNPNVPRPFIDDQIVRVNRHGGFEPFAFHGNRAPRPPVAPPFLPPVQQPPPFRYMPLDYFSPEKNDKVDSPNRGTKRPLQQTTEAQGTPPTEPAEAVFDLDSLRAAALKTKRRAPAKESKAPPAVPATTEDLAAPTANEPVAVPSTAPAAQTEEDPSLDALRMELLKSMGRKRRELPNQSPSEGSSHKASGTGQADTQGSQQELLPQQATPKEAPNETPPQEASHQEVPLPEAQVVPKSASPEPQAAPKLSPPEPAVPESPQFRPLTAMSQTLIIRLSSDDLSSELTKIRADSYDDAAKRFDKVLDDIRAEAASTKTTVSLINPKTPTSVNKEKEAVTTALQVAPPEKPVRAPNEQIDAPAPQGGTVAAPRSETAAAGAVDPTKVKPRAQSTTEPQEKAEVGKQQVVMKAGVAVDADILADPAKLEAERQACLANIREADGHIARLDAEIAALRLVIATREAETTSTSSVTACGA